MTQYVVVSKPNPHLPHDSMELKSPPPPDALNNEVAQKNADLFISQLMLGERHKQHQKMAEAQSRPGTQAGAKPLQAPRPTGARALPPLRPAEEAEEMRLRAALTADDEPEPDRQGRGGLLRLRPMQALVAALAILALIWPLPMGAVLLFLVWLAILSVALLRLVLAGSRWQRFARRYPARAERLRRMADRMAEKMDIVLDILPGSWADDLALPDLSQPVPAARKPRRDPHGRRYS